jgi:hypothetical protein
MLPKVDSIPWFTLHGWIHDVVYNISASGRYLIIIYQEFSQIRYGGRPHELSDLIIY